MKIEVLELVEHICKLRPREGQGYMDAIGDALVFLANMNDIVSMEEPPTIKRRWFPGGSPSGERVPGTRARLVLTFKTSEDRNKAAAQLKDGFRMFRVALNITGDPEIHGETEVLDQVISWVPYGLEGAPSE